MNKKIIWTLLIILFLFSCFMVYKRAQFENKYKNVELILDYDETVKKCAVTGNDINETLLKFKKAGITTIAFNEETIEGLIEYGSSAVIPPPAAELQTENTPAVYLRFDKNKLYVLDKINKYLPSVKKQKIKTNVVKLNAAYCDISSYGLGYDSNAIEKIKNLGFNIILRPRNKANLTPDLIVKYWEEIFNLQRAVNSQFSGIIFGGLENEVLGYPSLLSISGDKISGLSGLFGVVESAQAEKAQKGIEYLTLRSSDKAARVMSISDLYLAKLNPESVVEKYSLGVRERNIRWVYMHLFNASYGGKDVMGTNLDMAANLKDNLAGGFNFSGTRGMPGIPYHFGYIALAIFVFICLICFLLGGSRTAPTSKPADTVKILIIIIIITFATSLVFALLFFAKYDLLIKLLSVFALANSILFIMAAFKMGIEYLQDRADRMKKSLFENLKISATAFLIISFVSFTGALCLASLLFQRGFLLGIDQFRGVKLLMILPPLIVFYWYITACAKKKHEEIFNWPVTWGQAALLLILLAAGAYYIIRTGNIGEGTALEAEKSFRSYLANTLAVRPRLKEILFAHPALILGLSFIQDKKNYIICALLLLFGAIGQADIIDTFAHAHTPVIISLIRFGYGILFGAVVGVVCWAGYQIIRRGSGIRG